MIKSTYFALLLIGTLLTAQAEPTVSFFPVKSAVKVGDALTVDIIMTEFPNSEGGGVTVTFNPEVVQVVEVQINTSDWSFVTQPGVIDNAGGKVSDILFSSYSGVGGESLIATVELHAIGKGRSFLELKESLLNPFSSSGNAVAAIFKPAQIRVHSKKNKGRR